MHDAEGTIEFQHMWPEDQGFLCLRTQIQVGDESVCTTSCTWSWTSWLEGRLLMEQEDLGLSHHEAQEWSVIKSLLPRQRRGSEGMEFFPDGMCSGRQKETWPLPHAC